MASQLAACYGLPVAQGMHAMEAHIEPQSDHVL
jgi:hypothetical protein